jgi:hypothetical protein
VGSGTISARDNSPIHGMSAGGLRWQHDQVRQSGDGSNAMATAVGIDLGTTNSVIAAMEGGQPKSFRTPRATGLRRLWSRSSIR